MAAILVTARLCEPSSEWHITEDWYRRTALSDWLQLTEEEVNKARLSRPLIICLGTSQRSKRTCRSAAASCLPFASILPEHARGKPLEIWFEEEARIGQQGTLTRIWAMRGSRPRAPRDRRYEWTCAGIREAGGEASQGSAKASH